MDNESSISVEELDVMNQSILYNLFTPKPNHQYNDVLATLRINNINTFTKNIRKIQSNCELLYKCINDSTQVDTVHQGWLYDCQETPTKMWKYSVYLVDLKLFSTVTTEYQIDDGYYNFKLFLFVNSATQHKKIRVAFQ